MNAHNILSKFDLKALSATDTITKIVNQRSSTTTSLSDDFNKTKRYVEFKAALRQVFPLPPSESIFYVKGRVHVF